MLSFNLTIAGVLSQVFYSNTCFCSLCTSAIQFLN
uniref:Uncharacterized protein n=1 Tax=Arundo donax TaxID=35708 RepID=A0A0A9AR07_ARUDO